METSQATPTSRTDNSMRTRTQSTPLPGWLTYAGVMLAIGGVFGLADGIAMVNNSKIYAAGQEYMFGNLNAWGWTFIVLGAFQLLVAFGVFTASRLAIQTGVVLAGIYILAELVAAAHFPLWSLVLIGIQSTIIFGLVRGEGILAERERH